MHKNASARFYAGFLGQSSGGVKFSFSFQNIMVRARPLFSFSVAIRWGLIAILLCAFAALALDIFIFYRYSYRVVNLNPEPVARNVKIDRGGLQEALGFLDGRAKKFKELYGGGTTTSR